MTTCRPSPVHLIATGLAVTIVSAGAHANPVGEASRPWAHGVSAAERARARQLHRIGTAHLIESRVPEAIADFRAALRHWDHPGIHFNLAVAQEYMGRLPEARVSIENALRYSDRDPPPLSPAEHDRALALRDSLNRRIAELWIRCAEPGASVTIDSRPAARGPGATRRWVVPGSHQITASKPGYIRVDRSLVLQPGQRVDVAITLVPLAEAEGTRRWASWKPWAVFVAGVGVGVGAAALHWRSRGYDRAYHAAVMMRCPTGCLEAELPDDITRLAERASATWREAIFLDAVAVAGIAGGIALSYANRPTPPHPVSVHVSPLIAGRIFGLGMTGTF